jgi:DNA-binding CsgD family transcriptional regulator
MISTTYAILLYKKYPIPYLKAHYILYILLNIAIFFGLLFNYMQFNVMKSLSENAVRIFTHVYHFEVSLTIGIIIYFFVSMIFPLLKREWTKRGKILFICYFGVLILSHAVCSFFNILIGEAPLYFFCVIIIYISFHLISYIMVFKLYLQRKSYKSPIQRKILKRLSLFMFFVFTAVLVINTLQGMDLISLAEYIIFLPIIVFIINLIPLFRLKSFIKEIFPQETSPVSSDIFMNRLLKKYKITPREQQIIQLICNGKSNKEIEDELFLSLHTIKEYIYRIYKKTGVKNRVQLGNFFRGQ